MTRCTDYSWQKLVARLFLARYVRRRVGRLALDRSVRCILSNLLGKSARGMHAPFLPSVFFSPEMTNPAETKKTHENTSRTVSANHATRS